MDKKLFPLCYCCPQKSNQKGTKRLTETEGVVKSPTLAARLAPNP